ncbi:MAG: glycogen/starch/alpha-glucan phosphorylase [Planctomycetota bacterium]|nr:glycogen/starch/alpha-glucan phosphorylase [Planctomycetota bacterium]
MARTMIGIEMWRDYSNRMDSQALKMSFASHLKYSMGKDHVTATPLDLYYSLALAVRDRLIDRMIHTQTTYNRLRAKRVYYLSLEFLIGRALANNIFNLKFCDTATNTMKEFGLNLEEMCEAEPDAGLGNGGLGRLAACFMDSLATLEYPAYGYGIRYEFGIFRQEIADGFQVERPDQWLRFGNPWEICRPENAMAVPMYGRVEHGVDEKGNYCPRWADCQTVLGVPYDMPIVGYGNNTVNLLRLWSARASREFNLQIFNHGDYVKAVEEKNASETISKVLYPNDNVIEGKELRLKQQWFFVCCTIQDIVRRYKRNHDTMDAFPDEVAIQLNDTHPALAVAELMRTLVDLERVPWDKAWEMTRATIGYTNHTLLPEALEKWPVPLMGRLLPRHLEIIYEINHRFLQQVAARFPGDNDRMARMSLIEEGAEKQVRMAHLAVVGSHSVNGVAELHTELLKTQVLPDFYAMFPEKFNNKTNGVTQRRWLLQANNRLAAILKKRIGEGWVTNLYDLKRLEALADDGGFRDEFMAAKRANKERLAALVERETGVRLDPGSIFDVQVKRIHEYKRQHLNALRILMLYNRLKANPNMDVFPHSFIFGGKAAPGYYIAKLIIKFINELARIVNNDPAVQGRIKVAFVPDYNVSRAEVIMPGADVSEQISTAGMEASGTGNMKFTMNGALTVGTLDGANIEIRREAGEENFFLFGLTAEEIAALRGRYNPWDIYNRNPEVKAALDMLRSGALSPSNEDLFRPLYDSLLTYGDRFFVLADIESYDRKHVEVEAAYRDRSKWARMAILNVARCGRFSSDRTIEEYAREIWDLKRVPISLPGDTAVDPHARPGMPVCIRQEKPGR